MSVANFSYVGTYLKSAQNTFSVEIKDSFSTRFYKISGKTASALILTIVGIFETAISGALATPFFVLDKIVPENWDWAHRNALTAYTADSFQATWEAASSIFGFWTHEEIAIAAALEELEVGDTKKETFQIEEEPIVEKTITTKEARQIALIGIVATAGLLFLYATSSRISSFFQANSPVSDLKVIEPTTVKIAEGVLHRNICLTNATRPIQNSMTLVDKNFFPKVKYTPAIENVKIIPARLVQSEFAKELKSYWNWKIAPWQGVGILFLLFRTKLTDISTIVPMLSPSLLENEKRKSIASETNESLDDKLQLMYKPQIEADAAYMRQGRAILSSFWAATVTGAYPWGVVGAYGASAVCENAIASSKERVSKMADTRISLASALGTALGTWAMPGYYGSFLGGAIGTGIGYARSWN